MGALDFHPTGCPCCQSFNGGTVWLCGATEEATSWVPTMTYWKRGWNGRVYVACCNRNSLPSETETRVESFYSGYCVERYFRCAPDKGCNKNPGYKRTAHLRYFE